MYYGEKIAFYFAFIQRLTIWLIFPSIIGIGFFAAQLVHERVDISGVYCYSLLLYIWFIAFLWYWRRYESQQSYKWGMADYEPIISRPQYNGRPKISDVTGELVEGRPTTGRFVKRMCASYSIFAISVVFVLIIMTLLSQWYFLEKSKSIQMMITILNAAVILVNRKIFESVFFYLTEYEQHKYQGEYEGSLIFKLVSFAMVNSYFPLYYIAFRFTDLKRLQVQVPSIFASLILLQNFFEVIIPLLFVL
jgi:hypothetical protein